MSVPRIANRDARDYVRNRKEFEGSNLFARMVIVTNPGNDATGTEWTSRMVYVTYSYGHHWPLFVYDENAGVWFENVDYYSRTTSKHRSQAHPLLPTILCDKVTIRRAVYEGVNAVLLRGELK